MLLLLLVKAHLQLTQVMLLARLTWLAPLVLQYLLTLLMLRLARLVLLPLLSAPLAPLQDQPPSMLVALLLLPPAQVQVLGGCCCVQQLLHCLPGLHWRQRQLHCRLPRAWLSLQQRVQQMPQRLLQWPAPPRCALLDLQSCSLWNLSQLSASTPHSATALGRQA
jgi:hypothetical protein